MVKTYSARIILEGALFDANKQLQSNTNSKNVFDKLQRKLMSMKRMENSEHEKLRWD